MKSQKSVGRAFTDVREAFSGYFSHHDADFQLAGLLPTFGEHFFATTKGENLVRQAPLARGPQKGIRLRRAQEAAGVPSWSRAAAQSPWERTHDFYQKIVPAGLPASATK